MCRRKSKMLHGICDLLRGECEMPHEICDFSVEMQNAAQNLGFSARKIRNAVRDFRFSVQRGRKSDQVCNLEFSRSKIALAYVPNRCAISGIRRRGGYI